MRPIDADALYEKANMLNKKERRVVQSVLQVSPTVKAEPVKHGRWERAECGTFCTACTRVFDADFEIPRSVCESLPRCPNCGAKMDGKENGDD